jgi:LysR family transcriptional regulator, glycine cleavage system transcriptional activator
MRDVAALVMVEISESMASSSAREAGATNNDFESLGFRARMRIGSLHQGEAAGRAPQPHTAMTKRPDRLPPLDLLAAFEAVARHQSFTKAGAERFVTQSAISRQIKMLEEDLGAALFLRKHRRLELTEDGRRLFETCTTLFAQLRTEVARIRKPRTRTTLAVTSTPGFALLWLIPRLGQFTQAHPDVDVRLDADVAWRDLKADALDIAIRYGDVNDGHGQLLFRESVLPVCSAKLAHNVALALHAPADLQHHTLLQVAIPPGSTMPDEWGPWLQAAGLAGLRPAATLTFSNYDEAIAAALEGQGVALGRLPLVEHLLRTNKLVAPWRDAVPSARAYFLAINPDARASPAVLAFKEWLLAGAAPYAATALEPANVISAS